MTHRIARFILTSLALLGSLILVLTGTVQLGKRIHRFMLPPAERILAEADALADRSNWRAAEPLYRRAEVMFHQQGNAALELYEEKTRFAILRTIGKSASIKTMTYRLPPRH